jgi:predicted metalloendopeptidase
MSEDKPVHGIIGFTDKDLAVKIQAYEEDLHNSVFSVTQYLMRPDRSLSYEDMLLAIDGYKALEDYLIVKRVLRLKCLDDSIYFLILRDLAEIMNDIYMYFVHNRTELKDRIKFRLSLYQRDVYGFIKDCPSIRS